MTDHTTPTAIEIVLGLVDAADPRSIDLARSMQAVRDLAVVVLEGMEPADLIVTEGNENDVVLGYEVARQLATQRCVLHEDAGILTLDGADPQGRRVAAVALRPLRPERIEALGRMIERADGALVAAVSALSAADLETISGQTT